MYSIVYVTTLQDFALKAMQYKYSNNIRLLIVFDSAMLSSQYVLLISTQNLYTVGSAMINQTYIYGNSLQSNIVGVVVPHADSLQRWWAEHNPTSEGRSAIIVALLLYDYTSIVYTKSSGIIIIIIASSHH